MEYKVSVIVPVFKVEQYIERTVNSLLNQTLKNIEIILVDDESPDNCPQICDSYANKYKNIKVIHKKNAGLGMACNSGIEVAKGEYIAFCDSDDYVDINMYESMYNAAVKYNADAVFSGIKTVDQFGNVKTMNEYPNLNVLDEKRAIDKFLMDMIASKPEDTIERNIAMSAKIVLYNNSVISNNNLHFVSEREIISEDLVWNIDFLNHSNCIVTLPYTYYYYFCNTNSLSKQVRKDKFNYFKKMRIELNNKCISSYKMPIETKIRIDRMFIGYCRYYIGSIIKSNITSQEKKNIIFSICKDKIWDEIYNYYPINKMPLIHRLMFFIMRHNLYSLMSIVYKIKG